jgi:hypothetical protein
MITRRGYRGIRTYNMTAEEAEHIVPKPEESGDAWCGCYMCDQGRRQFNPQDAFYPARMIVCAICGNKRCPHGTDHRLACTGSNESNQPGSRYSHISG